MYILTTEDLNSLSFDYRKRYTIIRSKHNYETAEEFVLDVVYNCKPYVAKQQSIDVDKVIIVAISRNNKVVVLSDDTRCRDWLWLYFKQPSIGSAQLYDDIKPERILEKLNELFIAN